MVSETVSLMYHIADSLSPFPESSVKIRDIDRGMRGETYAQRVYA